MISIFLEEDVTMITIGMTATLRFLAKKLVIFVINLRLSLLRQKRSEILLFFDCSKTIFLVVHILVRSRVWVVRAKILQVDSRVRKGFKHWQQRSMHPLLLILSTHGKIKQPRSLTCRKQRAFAKP